MAKSPKRFFRTMRVDGSNIPARLFLLIVAGVIGLLWFLGVMFLSRSQGGTTWAMIYGLIVCDSVIVLSYIEAAGVAYFSRRRDWRVPMRLAERLVCYCSIGWVPAAGVMGLAVWLETSNIIQRWMTRLLGHWEPLQSLGLLVLVGAVAMMWFEVLVWIGVRQTKHANY